MSKKNMFNKFIDEKVDEKIEKSEDETTQIITDNEYNFDIPRSLLPWKNQANLIELTEQLVNAGYNSVDLIASSSLTELKNKTGIESYLLKDLLVNAQEASIFNFETAATLFTQRSERKRLLTLCKGLDLMLGGGVETGNITEFYGEFNTGKTQLCLQLAVNVALPVSEGGLGAKVVYIDTEGSFSPERVMQLCSRWEINPRQILDNILVGRAYTTDLQVMMLDNVININKDNQVKLVIIDSLTSNFRAEFIGKEALIDRQQKLSKHIQQLKRIADVYSIAVVVSNQVMATMDKNVTKPVGGNIVAHGLTHRILCSKLEGRKSIRKATLIASPSLPQKSALFEITGTGISDLL